MPAVSTVLFLLLCHVVADLTTAPPMESALESLTAKEEPSTLPDYDAYRVQERQKNTELAAVNAGNGDGANASSRHATPAASVPAVPQSSSFSGDSGSVRTGAGGDGKWRGPELLRRFLHFMHQNQVVFYIACSCVVTVMVLLYILMAWYGSCGVRSSTSRASDDSSSRRRLLSESHSLHDRQPLLANGRSPPGAPDSPDDELYSRARWRHYGRTPSPLSGAMSEIGGGSKALISSHPESALYL
ncbi:uncharacterized protein LOC142570732 [Dermacentor variabilis]|uniref:uncharacterized protein LOC142570732 n=1 Tax=Dermacentor variabilis TaxID=34621 RepID=UPI003F5C1855